MRGSEVSMPRSLPPEDIERFRKLGVIPTHQTVFFTDG